MGIITLVRHGQASFGTDNYDQLSGLGNEQSRVLGKYLLGIGVEFDGFYTGSLARHQQTLNGILSGSNKEVTPEIDSNLNEFEFMAVIKAYLVHHKLDFPDKNTPRSDYYRLLKRAMLSWQTGELDYLQLTESWDTFSNRTMKAITNVAESRHRNALVVTSGGVIGAVLRSILNAPAATAIDLNLQIRNASLTQCFVGKSGMSLSEFNSVSCFQSVDTRHLVTYS